MLNGMSNSANKLTIEHF